MSRNEPWRLCHINHVDVVRVDIVGDSFPLAGLLMAAYHFQCPQCDRKETIVQPMHQPSPKPRCHSCDIDMRRIYEAPGVSFKGTGWGKDAK